MRVLPSVEAQRKTTLREYSRASFVFVSTTRTPVDAVLRARRRSASATMAVGRSVRRPVACAAGSVDAWLEKYEPVEQPRSHGPQ